MADKKYTKLPAVHQTPVIKNFFDTTVEQLFSKANIDSVSAYIGRKEEDLYDAKDTYILQPTADRDKFSLEPVVNSIDQDTGLSTNKMFYEDYINVLKSYGVNTLNQNSVFDTQGYTFLPPINVDKFINYQEYFWSPNGPTPVIITGTSSNPINIEKDILGKKSYTTPSGTALRNGMVVTFSGDYVIPTKYKDDRRYIVEGVGSSILLHNKEQNFATVFSTEEYIPYDQTLIDADNSTLIPTTSDNDPRFFSGGLSGVESYVDVDGFGYTVDQKDATTGNPLWDGYVAPQGTQLVYVVGGIGAFDTEPFDSDNTQENPDYILMQRGAKDNNVWSRINFWHHKENFLSAGDELPSKNKRAVRPIIEFDRDIELYNFGTTGKFSVEISAEGLKKAEIEGRPNGNTVDDVTLEVGNFVIFPSEDVNIAKHIFLIGDSGSGTVSLTRMPADNNPAGAVDGDNNFEPYTASVGDVISVKFGARYQGIEYYWTDAGWQKGQQKTKINTPIKFNIYDRNKNALNDEAVYPSSTFAGNNIFGYTPATVNQTEDPVLGFPLEYKNFNNFSEISYTNFLDDYFYSYTPFGGTSKKQISGYIYYKKTQPSGDVVYDTAWRSFNEDIKQRVEDRYVIKDSDVTSQRKLYQISAVPKNSDSIVAGVVEKSIRVYVNGKRRTDFSYRSVNTAIEFETFDFKVLDIIDIFIDTTSGYITNNNTNGRYHVAQSWHSNLDNKDILTVSQPEYLEHFNDYVKDQEDISGDPLGSNNFDSITKDLRWADKIIQTDDDLQMSAFLFSNDKFNIKDSIDYVAEEYVKYKNRLKKEINRYVDGNDYEGLSYGDMLEVVLENVIAFNQGKNVFDNSYMSAFGDQYIEETVVVNNVLKKEYILTNYLDLTKIDNTIFVYDHDGDGVEKLLCVDYDYSITSTDGVVTLTFDSSYTLTLGNNIKIRMYDSNRESAQVPPTPSMLGLYPIYYPEIFTDNSFIEPIKMIRGHDGSKTVAKDDVHDFILLEFERRIYNNSLQEFRDKDSLPDLNIHNIRPGRFRSTGRSRDEFYGLLRTNFNFYVSRNEVDFVKNEYYDANNPWTWNYNNGTAKPSYWRGIYESCYDTDRPHTHPWEMLGFVRKPTWWDDQYGTDFTPANTNMWNDLEEGIIRQGTRANVTNDRFKNKSNPYRRIGLKYEIPVDEHGNLIAPANIITTTSTTKTNTWTETITGTPSASANSFIITDGLSVSEIGSNLNIKTNNIINHATGTFPTDDNDNFIADKEFTYKVTLRSGENPTSSYSNATSTGNSVIGIAVNGGLITNANTGITHSDSESWHYNSMYRNEVSRDSAGGTPDSNNIYGYIQPGHEVVNQNSYSNNEHSPIIGWAFDGFPIYGPYGYEDRANTSSSIVRIESGYSLRTTNRDSVATGPGGLPTGEFIEDYEYSTPAQGLDQYNGRYGPTPEFPGGTYYYVATIDENGNPAYPYTVGRSFAETPSEITTNATGTTTLDESGAETYKLSSTLITTYSSDSSLTNKDWKYSDGAPVENAWKISEGYPFAVVQSLLLAKPGKFASVFADPRKIVRSSANTNQLLDKDTGRRIKPKTVSLHGEVNTKSETTFTVGYTQFIDAFLRFQGLNTTKEFVKPLRTLNSKLGHKFAGYVDKDTMTVFSDTYSSTGNSSSLILPQEDIQVDVHVGPYSTTNDFTGVLITYTEDKKYKVEGYNSVKRFFEVEESNKTTGRLTQVKVGGEPADYSNYDNQKNYQSGSIVKSGYNFYQATKFAGSGTSVTDTTTWERLSTLPMVNAAEATLYLDGTGKTVKVEYGTTYDNVNDLFDFLISLGRKQSKMGFDFGEFNAEINDVNDWLYSGKQFLFWSIGKWAPGNTLNLSPAAAGMTFNAPLGRVSKIIDVDQSQFSILDEEGRSIKATECEIVRDGTTLKISPPADKQIYGLIVYTNEIEHSMTVSNKTIFGDTIYDDVFNQRQRRLKIKGKKTKNWNGTLTAEGYIITDDGLKPNFDTLASDMSKYNEIGHVPVEKQVYEASRRQYGYQERKYLREFELTQDDQYDFYTGMIRSKGTKNSIEVLLNSEKVLVPGSVNVYDEWALKSGDFGDVENYQTIDMNINESEIVNEKQLIQIAYPEDTVSKVAEVEVLDRTTKFFQRPFLEIEPPPAEIPGSFEYGGGTTAQATVNIGQDGTISNVEVTEPGYGYTINPAVTVVAAQLLTANITTTFLKPYAVSTSNVDVASLSGTANILITDHFSSNTNSVIDLGSVTTAEDVANAINLTAEVNANISASVIRTADANSEQYFVQIKGNDFTLAEQGLGNTLGNVLFLDAKRYQPRQRYSFETANSTSHSDVIVTVDGNATSGGAVGASNVDWVFDPGSRTTVTTTVLMSGNTSQSFEFTPMSVANADATTDEIASDNLNIINGSYPHVDIFINGNKLPETSEESLFTLTSNTVTGNSTINFLDVGAIPGAPFQPNSKIEIIERGTIDFEDTYQGDLPGSTMNIKVHANDALAAKLQKMRTFEIYPDRKDDATILIDVDDSDRLPVRPSDMAEKGLWPTTSSVSYVGLVDSKYSKLPNSGYVSKYNVQYQAFDIYDFENLFDVTKLSSATKLPKENNLVHFAKGEHEEFDVYKLTNTESNIQYIEYDEGVGTTFLYTDNSLSNVILDENTLANVDADYDHTKWYDYVLALKGKYVIDPYHANLQTFEGNPVYVTDQLEVDHPVTRFVTEEQVAESYVEMGNIEHTVPDVLTISTIEPQKSGKITKAEPIALRNYFQYARANVITSTGNVDIYRSVDADPRTRFTFNNQLTFDIYNGEIEGVKVGDWLKLHDSAGSNLDGNVFQVATLKPEGKVSLYANTSVLGGMSNVVSKDTLTFVNFGSYKKANANIDYAVQIFSRDNSFKVNDKVVFDVDNLGGSAGQEFTISDKRTDNTFFVKSRRFGTTTGLNVITDSANISLAQDTIKITAVPNFLSEKGTSYDTIGEGLVDGLSVKFKDASGTELAGNSFIISNVRKEKVINSDLTAAIGTFGNVTTPEAYLVDGTVTNSKLIPLEEIDLPPAGSTRVIEPGMYMWSENIADPIEVVTVAYDFDNAGNEPARKIIGANATTNTIQISNTAGVRVGDVVLVSAVLDMVSNVTVASVSGPNITLSENISSVTTTITPPQGEPYQVPWDETNSTNFNIELADGSVINKDDLLKFRHLGDGKVSNVTLKSNVSLSNLDVVEFCESVYEIPELGPVATKEVVVFEINPDTYTGGDLDESNLSFVVNEATKFTTDADLSSDFPENQYVKINANGIYDTIKRAKRVNVSANTFVIDTVMFEERRIPVTVQSDVTSGNSITINGDTGFMGIGMIVEGTGIPEDTRIANIDGSTIFTVDNNVTLSSGDIIEIYRATYEDATFMSANSVITTQTDHSFATDGSDKLIGRNITTYMFAPNYYNTTQKVVDIPSANTLVIDYPAFAHPHTVGDVTYLSKFDYDRYGENALTTSGNANVTAFFIADHMGNITLNGANVVTGVYPWHSVQQYLNDIKDEMYSKAATVIHKGSFAFNLPYIDVKSQYMNYQHNGGGGAGSYPGAGTAPLPGGQTVVNSTDGTSQTSTAGGAPASGNNSGGNAGQTFNNLLGSVESTTGGTKPDPIICGPNGTVPEPEGPTLTPQEIANQALLGALDNLVTNILPHQQEAVSPYAYKQLQLQGTNYNGAGGYSLGGPSYSGDGITYGDDPNTKWGTSKRVFDYETGQWKLVEQGTTWERDGVTYTMMSDGTITGSDGSIWVTTETRLLQGSKGALGADFGSYGLSQQTPSATLQKMEKGLGARIALLNPNIAEHARTFAMQNRGAGSDPTLLIGNPLYDCTTLIEHNHEYELDPDRPAECYRDANGKNPTGKKFEYHRCKHRNAQDEGCDAPYITKEVTDPNCITEYGSYLDAGFLLQSIAESGGTTSTKFVINTNNVPEGTKVQITVTGSANLADTDLTSNTFDMVIGANGKAEKTVTAVADATTEGTETLTFTLAEYDDDGNQTGQLTDTLNINDTSQSPVPKYTSLAKSGLNGDGLLQEGQTIAQSETVTFSLNAQHITDGATVTGTISGSGITRADFTDDSDINGSMQVTFTMNNTTGDNYRGTVSLTPAVDTLTEGNETFTLTLNSADSNGVGTGLPLSSSVTIADDSVSPEPDWEYVDYFLYHNSGPRVEDTTFELTGDSSTFDLVVFFDMYSANDRLDIYQGTSKFSTRTLIGGTSQNSFASTNPAGVCADMTTDELNRFKTMITNINNADPGGSPAGSVTSLVPMSQASQYGGSGTPNPDSEGGRKNAGKATFTYKQSNGRFITIRTTRGTDSSGSSVFRWGMDRIPINKGQSEWYWEQGTSGTTAGATAGARTGAGTAQQSYGVLPQVAVPQSTNTANFNFAHNKALATGKTQYHPTSTIARSNVPQNPISAWTFASGNPYNNNNGGISLPGNGPGLGTKPKVAAPGSGLKKKNFKNDPGFARGRVKSTSSDFTGSTSRPLNPLDGRPSFINQAGGVTDATDSPVPVQDTFNPHSLPQKPQPPMMKLKLLKKNKSGIYHNYNGGGSPVEMSLDINGYCQQDEIRMCAANTFDANNNAFTFRPGDGFWINDQYVDTVGATTPALMRQKLYDVMGYDNIDVTITNEPTGEQCLRVEVYNPGPSQTILRNGCKGGQLKEVLDFTVNNKKNESFSSSTYTAGSRTSTTTVSVDVSADTDSDANTPDAKVGSVSTVASGTDFITNTITAQQRMTSNNPSTITRGHNGQGYQKEDILRAVGGVAVSRASRPGEIQVLGLELVNGGRGYGTIDANGKYQMEADSVRIVVGGPGDSGAGLKLNTSGLSVDPDTGTIIAPSEAIIYGKNGVPASDPGEGFVFDNLPAINIVGNGVDAQFQFVTTGRDANDDSLVSTQEKVAIFEVTRVGDNGEILDLRVLDRGLYETFPGDLNSGVPLEYHINKQGGLDETEQEYVSRGSGTGGRVFMTGRLVGDCTQKGTLLQDLGLQEGPVTRKDFDKYIVDYGNSNSPKDPEGNPYFNFALDNRGGVPGIVIGTDQGDGIEIGENFPGALAPFNISTGAYIPETPPDIDLVEGSSASGDGTGGTAGPGRGTGIRFSSTNPFGITSDIGEFAIGSGLYKYELRRLDGVTPINITAEGTKAIHVDALALQSQRHSTETGLDLANISNVWIDDYNASGKWAYLENGNVIRQQENLVDTRFIRDVFTYDNETAEKEFDIDLYDPFKGILPGFIDKEIDLKTQTDPVVYDGRKTKYGRQQVGMRWWDTANVRYTWYEQGAGTYGATGYNNYERSLNWGEMFPGSTVEIYEWVESLNPPSNFAGGRAHPNRNFITEVHPDKNGKPQTHYYFWATDLSVISDMARKNYGKKRTTQDITRLLENLDQERVAYSGIISPDSLVVNTLGSLIRTEESVLSVNFKRKDTEAVQKHSSWNLASEGDNDSIIPDNLSMKLIDSLAGFNALKQTVPGSGLSESEKYGSKFRPRQTMFKDIKKARKQMFVIMNDIFKQLQMESTFLDFKDKLPKDYTLLVDSNWYEVQRVNKINNSKIYYDSSFKPLRKVSDTKQFGLLTNVLDKSIIQVQKDSSSRYRLYEYSKADDTFKLISMEKETVLWNPRVYENSQSLDMGMEIRAILVALYKDIFVNTYSIHWNKFFFEMLKYAYAEQGELDWAFKTTYLKVVKEETDLIPFKGFKVDNFDKAIDYFNEVKPYSSKIRNYSDIKKAPVEILSGSTTDFDRPPYYDEDSSSVRILDDSVNADLTILNSDKDYAGFVSNSDKVRTFDQRIVFDRVKGDMYENTSGGDVQKIIADGTTTIFNFNFTVEDESRLQVFVNGELIDKTSDNGNITNYSVDVGNSFVTFSDTNGVNNRVGTPQNGDKVELKYIDGFDPTLETLNVSIAKNIVAIESNSNINIANVSQKWTAPERLWKFDPDVRTEITNAFETAYGVGSASNTTITTNVSIMTSMVSDGNLTKALNLVKSKVSADFQGKELDANVFTDVVPGTHPSTFYTDTRGFDAYGWDDGLFDREVEIDNFVGIFSEDASGNVNYRVNNETVYGFDATTFLKHRYGPDRPEELMVVQPLETLIMDVTTAGNTQISPDSTDVRFLVFMDLFGKSDYYRRTIDPLTTLTADVNIWENEIFVVDASRLPDASKKDRAVVWINGERIEYENRDTTYNKLTGIIRGTRGTTPNTVLSAGEGVYNGEETENIRLRDANGNLIRDPEDFNWIKPVEIFDDTVPYDDDWDGIGSITVTSTANINYANVTFDADNANVTYGFDSSWDGSGSVKPTSRGVENYTLPSFDIDEVNGWDSGDQTLKEAKSLTDKGTVLKSNVSIIDFLHNFD